MSRLESAIVQLAADLRGLGLSWALVGGLAVTVRSRPRTTEDLDVAISVPGDGEAESVAFSLRELGYRYLPDEHALEPAAGGRLMTVRLSAPGGADKGVGVDLLFASSGIEPEVVAGAESLEVLPGLVIPVARTGHLVALKVLAFRKDREVDARDARWLWEVADRGERELARDALDLITERGFHRGKDLPAELERILQGAG